MVIKVKGGRYRVQTLINGKRESLYFGKKSDAEKKEAELKRMRELMRAGMEVPSESTLLVDYAASWLRKRETTHPKSTTEMDDARLRLYVLPTLGQLPMTVISSKMVRELLDTVQAEHTLANATRNRIRAVLHTLFHDAFMDEKIIANPVARVPLLVEPKVNHEPIERAAIEKVIEAAYQMSAQAGLLAVILCYNGRRISEAVPLQVKDFDIEREELHVRRIFEQETGIIQERIKGRPDGLVVPLFPRVRDAFVAHLRQTNIRKPTDYLFVRPTGLPLSTYRGREWIKQASNAAKVGTLTPHRLRKFFGAYAEECGFSKEDVQRMLGHSTVLVTERYTRRSAQPLVEKGKRLGFGELGDPSKVKKIRSRKKG